MKEEHIVKKLTKNGEVVKVKLPPNHKDKYNDNCVEKCERCGCYFDVDIGCECFL